MEIAEAIIDDIPQMCELLSLLFSQEAEFVPDADLQTEGLRQIINFPERGRILVLREGESVIAMVNLLFTISTALGGRVGIVEDMIVHPEHRGNGAGAMLLQAAIDLAKSAGCKRITLLTDRANESAQRFYERHGFSLSGMVPMRMFLG